MGGNVSVIFIMTNGARLYDKWIHINQPPLEIKCTKTTVTYTSLILFDICDDLLHTTEAEGCREQVLIGALPCQSGGKDYVEDIKEIYFRKSV